MRGFAITAAALSLTLAGCSSAASKKEEPALKVAYSLANVRTAIDLFTLVEHRLPSTLQELTKTSPKSGEPLIRSIPADPWGQPFRYRPTNPENLEYEVLSAGEDKVFGTEDDVAVKARAGG